jgi:hypothetical protein
VKACVEALSKLCSNRNLIWKKRESEGFLRRRPCLCVPASILTFLNDRIAGSPWIVFEFSHLRLKSNFQQTDSVQGIRQAISPAKRRVPLITSCNLFDTNTLHEV